MIDRFLPTNRLLLQKNNASDVIEESFIAFACVDTTAALINASLCSIAFCGSAAATATCAPIARVAAASVIAGAGIVVGTGGVVGTATVGGGAERVGRVPGRFAGLSGEPFLADNSQPIGDGAYSLRSEMFFVTNCQLSQTTLSMLACYSTQCINCQQTLVWVHHSRD